MSAPPSPSHRYDAIVIGAGPNGLVAATALARSGLKVVLLERRPIAGGLAGGEVFHPGYRSCGLLHDTTGLLADVVQQLDLARHGLRRSERPPPALVLGEPGEGLLLHHDPGEAASELSRCGSRDAKNYARYRSFIQRVRPFALRLLSEPPLDGFAPDRSGWMALASKALSLRRLGQRDMMELLRWGPMSLADALDEQFDCGMLKCGLAAAALHGCYGGPYSPGTGGVLLRYEALAGGAVVGGAAALVDALVGAARAARVDVRLSKSVSRITTRGGAVSGVTCDDGDALDARLVVSSCEPKRTLLTLLEPHRLPASVEADVRALRTRGLTAAVNLALNWSPRFRARPEVDIAFARTGSSLVALERAFDAAKYGGFSETPVLDIHVPSASTADVAPAGHAVVSILVHGVPYDLTGGWTDSRREELGDVVVGALSSHVDHLHDAIVAREVLTPVDIEERYGVPGGHVYHGEHGLDQLLVRPARSCARYATPIDGLYLCGSGTHPGGGITGAPGLLAARTILKSHKR